MSTWFEILSAIGAYPGDSPDRVSRSTRYLAAQFPNGAIAIAPHFREYEEGWQGGFSRDREKDLDWLRRHPLPPERILLKGLRVGGRAITYDGAHAVAFRAGRAGQLIAFAGEKSKEITVDGRTTVFADREMPAVAWAPVAPERRVPGGAVMQILAQGEGEIRIPAGDLNGSVALYAEGSTPGSRGAQVAVRVEAGTLIIKITPAVSGRWLYVTQN